MIFITGGAYEGKKKYARERFGFSDADFADASAASEEQLLKAVCIENFHEYVKRITDNNPEEFTQRLILENSSAVIIMNETGSGIIPLEKTERILREQTGRCGCLIAGASEEVIRVCCGIGVKIK